VGRRDPGLGMPDEAAGRAIREPPRAEGRPPPVGGLDATAAATAGAAALLDGLGTEAL